MSIGLRSLGITCERAMGKGSSIRKGRGGRSNNRNRCKSMGVGFREDGGSFRFARRVFKKSMPGRCVPTMRGNLGSSVLGKMLTKFPIAGVGTALCSNSCRSISSSRVTFGVTTDLTFEGNVRRTRPILLRPVVDLGVAVPRRCVNSIVNSVGGEEKGVLNVRPLNGKGRMVCTRTPRTRAFGCTVSLESVARNEKCFRVRVRGCSRIPCRVTREVVTRTGGGEWVVGKIVGVRSGPFFSLERGLGEDWCGA